MLNILGWVSISDWMVQKKVLKNDENLVQVYLQMDLSHGPSSRGGYVLQLESVKCMYASLSQSNRERLQFPESWLS
jgi:hypothetical protein